MKKVFCSVCGKRIKGPEICVSMKDYEDKVYPRTEVFVRY